LAEDEIDIFLNLHVKDIEGTLGDALADPEGSFGTDSASDLLDVIQKGIEGMWDKTDDLQGKDLRNSIEAMMSDSQKVERALQSVLASLDGLDEDGISETLGDILSEVNFVGKLNEMMLKMVGEGTEISSDISKLFEDAQELLKNSNVVNSERYEKFLSKLADVSQEVSEKGSPRDQMEMYNLLRQIPTPSMTGVDIRTMANQLDEARAVIEGTITRDDEGKVIRKRPLNIGDIATIDGIIGEFKSKIVLIDEEYAFQRKQGEAIVKALAEARFPEMMGEVLTLWQIVNAFRDEGDSIRMSLDGVKEDIKQLKEAAIAFADIGSLISTVIVNALTTTKMSDVMRHHIKTAIDDFLSSGNINFKIEGQEISRKLISDIASLIYDNQSNIERESFLGVLDLLSSQLTRLQAFMQDRINKGLPMTVNMMKDVTKDQRDNFGMKQGFMKSLETMITIPKIFKDWIEKKSYHDIRRRLQKYRQRGADIDHFGEEDRERFDEVFGKELIDELLAGDKDSLHKILSVLIDKKIKDEDEIREALTQVPQNLDADSIVDYLRDIESMDESNEIDKALADVPLEPKEVDMAKVDALTPPTDDPDKVTEGEPPDFMDYFNGVETMFNNKFNDYESETMYSYIKKIDSVETIMRTRFDTVDSKLDQLIGLFGQSRSHSSSNASLDDSPEQPKQSEDKLGWGWERLKRFGRGS